MPMGTSARFDAVLRAGEAHRREAAPIGAPGDLPAGALKGKQAADALKKAASADSVIVNDPGAAPVFSKAQSTPAAPQGFQMRKGGGAKPVKADGLGNQVVAKSSEVVKDLIKEYEKDQAERVEALRKARAEGEECAKRRIKAVDAFRDQEEKAARTAIAKLEEMLKKKEAALDKLQNASDESVRKIEQMTREGGESSKQVEEMKKTIAQLEAEKANIEKELETTKADANKARDAATAHEAAELAKLAAEWQAKLDKAEKKAADGDVVSSNKVKEYASKLEKATEELEVKTKEIQGLEKGAYEHDSKFRKAAKAACDALSEYTKENSEEAFRKTMKDFVTSAPAGM